MPSPNKVAAIYVPVELENDVEEFLRQKYHLRLLGQSPQRGSNGERVAADRRTLTDSSSPLRMAHCRSDSSMTGDRVRQQAGKRGETPRSRLATTPTASTTRNVTVSERAAQQRQSMERTNTKTPMRRANSASKPDPELWVRLSTPTRRVPTPSATPHAKSYSASKRKSVSEGPTIFSRLYEQGLSQQSRHEQAVEEARRRRIAHEDAEIRRGKVLMHVLSNSENYALRGAAFEEKMAEALEGKRYTEGEIREVSTRLSKCTERSAKVPITKEERELTFHPKVSDPSSSSREQIDEHFNVLYMDARKKERSRTDLLDKYRDKERRTVFERRMRDDAAFRRRVEEDPSLGERFLKTINL